MVRALTKNERILHARKLWRQGRRSLSSAAGLYRVSPDELLVATPKRGRPRQKATKKVVLRAKKAVVSRVATAMAIIRASPSGRRKRKIGRKAIVDESRLSDWKVRRVKENFHIPKRKLKKTNKNVQ